MRYKRGTSLLRMRIVSLVPAATEWLVAFGAGPLVVAHTDACPRQPGAAVLSRAAAVSEIAPLAPTLVVVPEPRDAPAGLVFAPRTFKQVLDAVLELASRAGRLREAMAVIGAGERRVAALRARIGASRDGRLAGEPPPAAAYLRRVAPPLVAGAWVPDLLALAGAEPRLAATGGPDRAVAEEDLASLDWLLAAPPPLASAASRVRYVEVDVDVPGPRLYDAIDAFAAAIHGAVAPAGEVLA